MSKRVLVLSAGVGSGHNMAGRVVNKLLNAVPWLVGWGYDAVDAPFSLTRPIEVWDRLNTLSTVRRIRNFNPDAVVCTHFLPARLTSLMLARELITSSIFVVTTDYDFQGLWLNPPFSRIFVAREETKAYMEAIGVPADRVTASGIPVRPLFGEPVDADAVRRRYDLDARLPLLLLSAGAAGGSYTNAVVRQTLRISTDFQAVVVCGRNAQLKAEVEGIVAGRPDRYRVLGYSTDMP